MRELFLDIMDGRSCLPSPKEGGSISIKALQPTWYKMSVCVHARCASIVAHKPPAYTTRLKAALYEGLSLVKYIKMGASI